MEMDTQSALITDAVCDTRLSVDQAQLLVPSIDTSILLSVRSQECYDCEYLPLTASTSSCNQLLSRWCWDFKLISSSDSTNEITSKSYCFGEHGNYNLIASSDSIDISITKQSKDTLAPLWSAFLIVLSIIIVFKTIEYLRLTQKSLQPFFTAIGLSHPDWKNEDKTTLKTQLLDEKGDSNKKEEVEKIKPVVRKRVVSLDTFRGFALFTMIFVNYGGGGYWFFDHSSWHGLTVADLLFPWFLFMMGVSTYLSFRSMKRANLTATQILTKSFIRSCKLFGVGLFLNNGYDLKRFRVPGVLQYFAFSNMITALVVVGCKDYVEEQQEKLAALSDNENDNENTLPGSTKSKSSSNSNWLIQFISKLSPGDRAMLGYWPEWIIQALLVLLYLSIHLGAKAPGCPVGYQGPGGLADNGNHPDCTGGIHKYIDEKLFGPGHIYDEPTCQELYGCGTYDPEGALGSLTACTVTYLGLIAGRMLLHFEQPGERISRWLIYSFILLFIAGCMCGFSQNEGWVPVNKNMWTTSFGLCMAGAGTFCLAITYLLVDVWNVWSGAPFVYMGMNSILIYACHEIFEEYFPFGYATDHTSHAALLACDMMGATWWMLIAYYCHTIKFYVKL